MLYLIYTKNISYPTSISIKDREVETMNDYPGSVWFVAPTDREVEVYQRESIFFCSMLLIIAALALLVEGEVKYYAWGLLIALFVVKRSW